MSHGCVVSGCPCDSLGKFYMTSFMMFCIVREMWLNSNAVHAASKIRSTYLSAYSQAEFAMSEFYRKFSAGSLSPQPQDGVGQVKKSNDLFLAVLKRGLSRHDITSFFHDYYLPCIFGEQNFSENMP